MYILWCSVTAVLLVANAKGAILSDCSDVNTKLILECAGSILYGEGVCGENVCAQVSKKGTAKINLVKI